MNGTAVKLENPIETCGVQEGRQGTKSTGQRTIQTLDRDGPTSVIEVAIATKAYLIDRDQTWANLHKIRSISSISGDRCRLTEDGTNRLTEKRGQYGGCDEVV